MWDIGSPAKSRLFPHCFNAVRRERIPMDIMLPEVAAASKPEPERALPGQVVVAFQGGGALNAYQGGVYQALHEAGIEPDWVIGTSSGAINAGIIAGNP